MTISAMTFKCDRDGAEAAGSTLGPGALPDNWTMLQLGGNAMMPVIGHLCPACTNGLSEYMAAAGGNFTIKVPPMAGGTS